MKFRDSFIMLPIALMCITHVFVSNVQLLNHPTVSTIQNLREIKTMGINLIKPTTQPKLTPEQARQIILAAGINSRGSKQVIVEYQLVSDHSIQVPHIGFLHNTPCYIISFEDLSIQGHSAPGHRPPMSHTEMNWVIDANTGQPYFGFDYR